MFRKHAANCKNSEPSLKRQSVGLGDQHADLDAGADVDADVDAVADKGMDGSRDTNSLLTKGAPKMQSQQWSRAKKMEMICTNQLLKKANLTIFSDVENMCFKNQWLLLVITENEME